jgi:hypothetical protein
VNKIGVWELDAQENIEEPKNGYNQLEDWLRNHFSEFVRTIFLSLGNLNSTMSALKAALRGILRQERSLLEAIYPFEYAYRCPFFESSIGEHIRHSLNHLQEPLARISPAPLHYDVRARGTVMESHPEAALQKVGELSALLDKLEISTQTPEPVVAFFMLSDDGVELPFDSTLPRELAFAVHHAIHHHAIVRFLVKRNCSHISLPSDFGMAPSTAHSAK